MDNSNVVVLQMHVRVEDLLSFREGHADAGEVEAIARHLAVCEQCVAYLDSYRRTVDVCRQLGRAEDPVPPGVPEDLVRAILQARKHR